MSQPTVIQLKYPVTIKGKGEVTELSMRRPLVRDFRKATKTGSDQEKEIKLFADLCSVAPDEIESLDMNDYLNLQKAHAAFFEEAPPVSS